MQKRLFVLIIILLLNPKLNINAQQLKGLTITPAIIATSQKAGESKTYNLKIYSDTDKTVNVSVKLLNKDSAQSQPVLDENVPEELLGWFFNLQKQIFVKASEESSYNVIINIPDSFFGNYNFALVFEESSPQVVDSNSSAETSSEIAIPFIFNVVRDGTNLDEDLNISKFKINPVLSFDGKNSFNISLLNNGISYLIPRGILSIQPEHVIGSFKEQDVSINDDKRILLKNGTLDLNFDRNFEQNSIGQYRATVTIVYGMQNEITTQDVYFWVFPEWTLVLVFLITLLIIFLVLKKVYIIRKTK